ncbi:hypothetical protein BVRB_5g106990 [Beta vulgaris subsp. vulgaris]|nr:hypothetical protein BVRB_5g106990 [Beta vulgaris subsp. vulgaris]
MSGAKQTLKELRHQILARRTLRHPPPDAVPCLDVQPLREHAWLESLADAGVVTDTSVFDRLARESAPSHPSHPPVVNLGSDSDSITSMETDAIPSTSSRDHASHPSQIDIGESSSMPPSRLEPIPDRDDVLHSGIWLPIDYSSDPKNTVICKSRRATALELKYCEVAKDLRALDVREDESIFADIPANGGTLGYCLLKGLQFPFDRPGDKLVVPATQLAHDLVVVTQYLEYQRATEGAMEVIKGLEATRDCALSQVTQLKADLEAEKITKAEVDKEVAELRPKAKELEDVKTKNQNLELGLQAAKDEMVVDVEGAKAEAGQTAVAGFKKSEEFIGLLGERYHGGWVATKSVSAIPILTLIGSEWRSLLAKVPICNPWWMSLISTSRKSLPMSCLLLKMGCLPPEDFGGHLQHLP